MFIVMKEFHVINFLQKLVQLYPVFLLHIYIFIFSWNYFVYYIILYIIL